jgi:hypothetical protein
MEEMSRLLVLQMVYRDETLVEWGEDLFFGERTRCLWLFQRMHSERELEAVVSRTQWSDSRHHSLNMIWVRHPRRTSARRQKGSELGATLKHLAEGPGCAWVVQSLRSGRNPKMAGTYSNRELTMAKASRQCGVRGCCRK